MRSKNPSGYIVTFGTASDTPGLSRNMCSLVALFPIGWRLARRSAMVRESAMFSGGFLDTVVRARVSSGLGLILGACYVCQPVTNFRQL